MRRFQQVLLLLMLLVIAVFILFFILENETKVTLSFMSYMTPQIPLAVLIVVAFLLGLILALVISSLVLFKFRIKLATANKQLAACKKELAARNTTNATLITK